VVQRAAQNFEPHTLVDFLREVATEFHSFYHDCRILGEEEATVQARLQLARATSRVLKNGFAILGISAPERM
jgi:arginyl-tRNA synthetase